MSREKVLEEISNIKIYQWENGYRFTLAPILLSGFVKPEKQEQKLLDIGTGIGIIPVLLFKRFPKWTIDGVEIQRDLYRLSKENYSLNNIVGRIYYKDIDNFKNYNYYDIIVTNPPFFKKGRIPLNEEIAKSKHEICLDLRKLAKNVSKLLKNKGYFYCIYSVNRLLEVLNSFREFNIQPIGIKFIQSFKEREPNLVLIVFRKNVKTDLKCFKPVIIYEEENIFTEEIKSLYGMGNLEW